MDENYYVLTARMDQVIDWWFKQVVTAKIDTEKIDLFLSTFMRFLLTSPDAIMLEESIQQKYLYDENGTYTELHWKLCDLSMLMVPQLDPDVLTLYIDNVCNNIVGMKPSQVKAFLKEYPYLAFHGALRMRCYEQLLKITN